MWLRSVPASDLHPSLRIHLVVSLLKDTSYVISYFGLVLNGPLKEIKSGFILAKLQIWELIKVFLHISGADILLLLSVLIRLELLHKLDLPYLRHLFQLLKQVVELLV